MAIRWEQKRPDEVRDYSHDWSAWLDGDTITASVWDEEGVTLDSDASDGTTVTAWVSGGTNGTTARLVNTIETAAGRTESQTFTLLVRSIEEPVSLAEAKAQCRIQDDNDEDALILALVTAAREWVENFTGRVLVQREFTDSFSCFGSYLELNQRPVVGTPTIAYVDTDDAEQAFASIITSGSRYPFRIYPASDSSWPTIASNTTITVTYTAGYPEGEVPQSLVQAMLLLIGHWWNNRESVVIGSTATEVPMAVNALCMPYRSPLL
jgi:uncharacterized phiE125 gp8 family phage protein